MKWAGFFYIAIAWWNLTNPCLFSNSIAPIEYKNEIHKSMHTFYQIISDKNVSHWILFGVAIFYFLACLIKDIFNLLTCCCRRKEIHKGGFENLLDFP